MDQNATLLEVCPAQEAWDIVSGKWKPCIIHVLAEKPMRFNELKRSVPGITQRMLTRQLRELEANGIIARKQISVVPLHVEYNLTQLGETILPIFVALTDWWENHKHQILAIRETQSNNA